MNKAKILKEIKHLILQENKKTISHLMIYLKDIDDDGIKEVIAKYYINLKEHELVFKYLNDAWVIYQYNTFKLYPAYINTIGGRSYGYINKIGKYIIKPMYENAMPFQGEYAITQKEKLYGIIDGKGNIVIKPKYLQINPSYQNRWVVEDAYGYHIINQEGIVLTNKTYHYIGAFSENKVVASIRLDEQILFGYLNQDGEEIIPFIYQEANDFKNQKAIVKKESYHLINPKGETLFTYPYLYVGDYGDGLLVYQNNDLYGYIQENGTIVIEAQYDACKKFLEGFAIVSNTKDDLYYYGVINQKGEIVVPIKYNNIVSLGCRRFSVGKAISKKIPYLGVKYALSDENHDLLTDFIFSDLKPYQYHFASATTKEKTFYIDLVGEIINRLPIVNGEGELIFLGNIIKANIDYEAYYLDEDGQIVNCPNYIIPIKTNTDVIINKYKPNSNYLVYYPQIECFTIHKEVNLKLKKLSKVKPVPTYIQYQYYGNFTVLFYQKNLLELEIDGYTYQFGAAHGLPYRQYVHLDLKTGTFYTLSDLFKKDCSYLSLFTDWVKEKTKDEKQYFVDEAFEIEEDPLFYVDDKKLYLIFKPYDIAPYSEGFVKFQIPFESIIECINDNGAFWNAF